MLTAIYCTRCSNAILPEHPTVNSKHVGHDWVHCDDREGGDRMTLGIVTFVRPREKTAFKWMDTN